MWLFGVGGYFCGNILGETLVPPGQGKAYDELAQ